MKILKFKASKRRSKRQKVYKERIISLSIFRETGKIAVLKEGVNNIYLDKLHNKRAA